MEFLGTKCVNGRIKLKQPRINKFQLFKYCHFPSCSGKNIYARSLLNSDFLKELDIVRTLRWFVISLSGRVFAV